MSPIGGFGHDLALAFVGYLPAIAGAYISILVLRYPDLTIEASWSLAGIVACLAAGSMPPLLAVTVGPLIGALCGLVTAVVFHFTGRAKLLAGLISYWILEAVGFHVLGDSASIYLSKHSRTGFGVSDSDALSLAIYSGFAGIAFLALLGWQRSLWGRRARLVGENPSASSFFRLSLDREFSLGLILSNALVGFGGGLWALYYGHASNLQGIGLVIKAFVALLLGNEVLQVTGVVKRVAPAAVVVGTFLLVLLSVSTEMLQVQVTTLIGWNWLRPTDKQIAVSLVLVTLLRARRKKAIRESAVSEW